MMDVFARIISIAKLLPRLGYLNLLRVVRHRFFLKLQLHPACRLRSEIENGLFFREVLSSRNLLATKSWVSTLKYFDWFEVYIPVNGSPNWFSMPISEGPDWPARGPWWKLMSANRGDIKEIWDLSRFNWVLAMAQRAANGSSRDLQRLNEWLSDWSEKNPPYNGPNWGCGQEASIRVLHLAIAAFILQQDREPLSALISLIKAHLIRIESTLSYALSQDNNHGILEAAGLFVGGEWLYFVSKDARWKNKAAIGRKWLEERAQRLISPDGGFSMYSIAYHREFLDALSICEFWRGKYGLDNFSPAFSERVIKATSWLRSFVDSETGDSPNIGANDGTRLLPLTDTDYRDFRPSVQLASVLFSGQSAYCHEGLWNLPLNWLGIKVPDEILPNEGSRLFDDCGFAVICGKDVKTDCKVFIRYPRFKFRPSHGDALHLDFWVNGENVFRDGGSYTYDPSMETLDYFSGTESHNTVQFDGFEQMPRLSTFLFGDWLDSAECSRIQIRDGAVFFKASYSDKRMARHERSIQLAPGRLFVSDRVENFTEKAVLRWRLAQRDWKLEDDVLVCDLYRIEFHSTVPITRYEIVKGYESRYYNQRNELPVLEVEVCLPGIITTTVHFQNIGRQP